MNDTPAAIHLLHIGKTGGTSLKQMMKSDGVETTGTGHKLVLHYHGTRLVDVFGANPADLAVFFLRDPVSRFVSGFNSRLRQGSVTPGIPWKPNERVAFGRFETANDLAEALTDSDPVRQDRAFVAIDAISHTRMGYPYWLRSPAYLDSRLERIAFVGLQETYAEDVHRLMAVLRMPPVVVEHQHRAPSTAATHLSEVAEENIRSWYAADIELYEWALRRRESWTADRVTLASRA